MNDETCVTRRPWRRSPARGRAAAAILVTAWLALLISGCGGSGGGSSTAAGGSHSAGASSIPPSALAFARCMRSHGVHGWPDPTTSGVFDKAKLSPQQLGVSSSQLHAVSRTCGHLIPAGGSPSQSASRTRAQTAALLAFAQCLRSHGFPSFPDPATNGQITHQMLAGAGINLHQPGVLQAADVCVGVTHGVITKAAVARFVAGQ